MVAISTLISGTAILLSSGVFANPIESRAPRDQIFVLNFFKLCNRIDFVANRPHFLEDSTTELTGSRGCFNVPEGYGALVIEDQPTHPACSIYTYNGLGCSGGRQGPFRESNTQPARCDSVPGSLSYRVVCPPGET